MQFFIEPDFPPHPQSYRAVCEACGAGARGEPILNVASMSIDHEDGMYTNLYLCKFCVCEWAHAFGMLLPVETETLVAENYQLEGRLAEALNELEGLRAVRAAVRRVVKQDDLEVPEWLVEAETE